MATYISTDNTFIILCLKTLRFFAIGYLPVLKFRRRSSYSAIFSEKFNSRLINWIITIINIIFDLTMKRQTNIDLTQKISPA